MIGGVASKLAAPFSYRAKNPKAQKMNKIFEPSACSSYPIRDSTAQVAYCHLTSPCSFAREWRFFIQDLDIKRYNADIKALLLQTLLQLL